MEAAAQAKRETVVKVEADREAADRAEREAAERDRGADEPAECEYCPATRVRLRAMSEPAEAFTIRLYLLPLHIDFSLTALKYTPAT